MEENTNDDTHSRQVIASAIDDDCLILEEPDTGDRISWPLNKIPQPFELGNPLNLVLTSSASGSEFASSKDISASHQKEPDNEADSSSKESRMRKMLEDLVN